MAQLPAKVKDRFLYTALSSYLPCRHRGKVRDTFTLPEPDLLLVVASDRVSIFDFVLPALIPQKGELLTAVTIFWLTQVLSDVVHHLAAWGHRIDQFLPAELRHNQILQRRSLVVQRLEMLPVECIVRGYLTGSGWRAYQQGQPIDDHILPDGLHDGARLPEPIFTPTTKSATGHDAPLPRQEVAEKHGHWLEEHSLKLFTTLAEYARERGVILADTKFEFGAPSVLADEVGTPDSSRFWDYQEWEEASTELRSPAPYDKELVRQWGMSVPLPNEPHGIHHLEPANEEHVAFVHGLTVPSSVLEQTAARYHAIFQRLTGWSLSQFQQRFLGC